MSPFVRDKLNAQGQLDVERQKRELLQIEDVKVGTGPVTAWGRCLSADLTVHYSDGSLVYQGPIDTYVGFIDITGIENDVRGGNLLRSNNWGVQLGLNGMAIGGQRRSLSTGVWSARESQWTLVPRPAVV
jgi:hypothetical protein